MENGGAFLGNQGQNPESNTNFSGCGVKRK